MRTSSSLGDPPPRWTGEGRWALIKGDAVHGVFDTPDEATAAGIQRFLCTAFLVRQIHTFEPVRPFPNRWM